MPPLPRRGRREKFHPTIRPGRVPPEPTTARGDWLRDFVDSLPQTVFEVDAEGRLLYSNRKSFEMFGFPPGVRESGLNCFDYLVPEERERARTNMALLFREGKESGNGSEYTARRKDGSTFPVIIRIVPILRPGVPPLFRGMIVDISERKKIEQDLRETREHLRYSALHDSLTGLPNRRLLFEQLERMIRGKRRDDEPFGLIFLDLDDFKEINDRLGHAAGDAVLRIAGERIREGLRSSDMVARFGGDEFVILAEGAGTQEALRTIAGKIEALLLRPLSLGTTETADLPAGGLALSWGWSLFPAEGLTADDLLRTADTRMYQAKRSRRATAL